MTAGERGASSWPATGRCCSTTRPRPGSSLRARCTCSPSRPATGPVGGAPRVPGRDGRACSECVATLASHRCRSARDDARASRDGRRAPGAGRIRSLSSAVGRPAARRIALPADSSIDASTAPPTATAGPGVDDRCSARSIALRGRRRRGRRDCGSRGASSTADRRPAARTPARRPLDAFHRRARRAGDDVDSAERAARSRARQAADDAAPRRRAARPARLLRGRRTRRSRGGGHRRRSDPLLAACRVVGARSASRRGAASLASRSP